MKFPRPLALLILAASLVTQAQAFGPPPAPRATPTATAKAPPAAKPAKPKPTPAPDLISTAPVPIEAQLEGPETVTPPAGFVIRYKTTKDARVIWDNAYPEGAMPGFKATDENGESLLIFVSTVPGEYQFNISAQISVDKKDGFDPFATDRLVVSTGPPKPPEPPGPPRPPVPPGPDVPTTKATAATYVYEKDSHVVPSEVKAALGRLNSETTILGSMYEQDVTDGDGDVPEQYKVPVKAARESGLPALVVTSGGTVLKVIPKPTTAAQVLEAVK